MPNRRDILKLSGAAALGLLATGNGEVSAEASGPKINVAGYPYDRVQAIKDGLVGIDRADVSFHDMKTSTAINDLRHSVPRKTYEVTELGLIPYVIQSTSTKDFAITYLDPRVHFEDIPASKYICTCRFRDREAGGPCAVKRIGTPGYGIKCHHLDSRHAA